LQDVGNLNTQVHRRQAVDRQYVAVRLVSQHRHQAPALYVIADEAERDLVGEAEDAGVEMGDQGGAAGAIGLARGGRVGRLHDIETQAQLGVHAHRLLRVEMGMADPEDAAPGLADPARQFQQRGDVITAHLVGEADVEGEVVGFFRRGRGPSEGDGRASRHHQPHGSIAHGARGQQPALRFAHRHHRSGGERAKDERVRIQRTEPNRPPDARYNANTVETEWDFKPRPGARVVEHAFDQPWPEKTTRPDHHQVVVGVDLGDPIVEWRGDRTIPDIERRANHRSAALREHWLDGGDRGALPQIVVGRAAEVEEAERAH